MFNAKAKKIAALEEALEVTDRQNQNLRREVIELGASVAGQAAAIEKMTAGGDKIAEAISLLALSVAEAGDKQARATSANVGPQDRVARALQDYLSKGE